MICHKVCVIGLGYIGLPTAAVIASRGVEVLGVDISQQVVTTINQGQIHIVEPDLEIVVQAAVQTGHLRAATQPEQADVFIIAVPTPFKEDFAPDLSHIQSAVSALAPHLQAGNLVILESTSPVGTTEQVSEWLQALRPDLHCPTKTSHQADIAIAYCPERVLPGRILRELVDNDRVVGGITSQCTASAIALYQLFVQGQCLPSDAKTAEMTKLTENVYRDVNIALANELSMVCEKFDIDVWQLIALANHHPRVNILKPGPGVGGHCIAVDPWFIVKAVPEQAQLMRVAREVNMQKTEHVFNKIFHEAKKLDNPVIACLGLSYKKNIDDLRASPALEITTRLAAENIAPLLVCEPHLKTLPDALSAYPDVEYVALEQAVHLADIIVLLVDHQPFLQIDKSSLVGKVVLDTCGVWE